MLVEFLYFFSVLDSVSPPKHLYNVKNKMFILQKASFIVRKRELLEASTMSAFCLLPHYQTPDLYK